jgi:integrase
MFAYKNYLDEKYAPGTVNNHLSTLKSFYNAYDIHLISIRPHKGDTVQDKNVSRLIKKGEIKKMIDVAITRDRAIIYLMCLTGMAQNEVRNLSIRKFMKHAGEAINKEIKTIEELFEHEDDILKEIIIMEIVRKKVNYRHHVLIPPEASQQIIIYLKERYYNRNINRRITDLNGTIFVTNKGTQMSRTSISSEIRRVGFLAGFTKEFGAYCFWRPHAFRKYFISTIIRNTGDILLADYLVGHTINQVTRAYWIMQPEELKEKYLKVYEHLSIDNVKITNFNTDGAKMAEMVQKLEKQQEIIQTLMEDHRNLKSQIKIQDEYY